MNDELIKNLSISCNHSERTVRNYRNALRKYCEYYDITLQEFF
ncbi:site-specific integrase [uncultured Methanobrevibacter sp.]